MSEESCELVWEDVPSAMGPLRLVERDGVVVGLEFEEWKVQQPLEQAVEGATRHGESLRAYIDGDLSALDGWAVEFERGTELQRSVWRALLEIPAGTTISYGELARRVGRPSAVRAVANAVGSNPIAVAVPCHRVIGADGSLTGFGGGLDRKRWLLNHEAGATQLNLLGSS